MAHINELIDYTVEVFIVYDKKILLVYHKALQKWLPVGGHIELDEDPEEALFRETKEETGLDIEILSNKLDLRTDSFKSLFTPLYLDIHRINDTHRHVGMVYFARSLTDKVSLEKEEHEQVRWFSQKDLSNPKYSILEDVKVYAKKALHYRAKN